MILRKTYDNLKERDPTTADNLWVPNSYFLPILRWVFFGTCCIWKISHQFGSRRDGAKKVVNWLPKPPTMRQYWIIPGF